MTNAEIQRRILEWTGSKVELQDIDVVVWTIVHDQDVFDAVIEIHKKLQSEMGD